MVKLGYEKFLVSRMADGIFFLLHDYTIISMEVNVSRVEELMKVLQHSYFD